MKLSIPLIISILIVLLLSACRIDPEWSVSVAGSESSQSVLRVLPAEAGQAVVLSSTKEGWQFKRYSDKGLLADEKSLAVASPIQLVDSQFYAGRYYLLTADTEGSELRVYTPQFELAWKAQFATADLRAMAVQGTRVYLSGDRSLVLNQEGRLLSQIDHSGSVYTELEVGLFGDLYVASADRVSAYTKEGGQLWQRPMVSAPSQSSTNSLQWVSGELFFAQAGDDGSGITATMLSARTGEVKWQRSLEPLDANPHVRHFATQFLVRDNGEVLALQSTDKLRQLTALGAAHGKPQWRVDYPSRGATAAQLAVGPDGESVVVAGYGRTEEFSSEGRRLAWHTAASHTVDGSQLLVSAHGVYVAEAHASDWRLSFFKR